MAARRKPHPSEEFEAHFIDSAAYFTACEFLGRGRYERHEFRTLSAAMSYAERQPQRRLMIYAVSRHGRSIFVSRRDVPKLCLPLFDHMRETTNQPPVRPAARRPEAAPASVPVTIKFRGRMHHGRYCSHDGRVLVIGSHGSRSVRLGDLPPELAARILLRELVVAAALDDA
jgi:hypothetical protein